MLETVDRSVRICISRPYLLQTKTIFCEGRKERKTIRDGHAHYITPLKAVRCDRRGGKRQIDRRAIPRTTILERGQSKVLLLLFGYRAIAIAISTSISNFSRSVGIRVATHLDQWCFVHLSSQTLTYLRLPFASEHTNDRIYGSSYLIPDPTSLTNLL